MTKVHFNLPWGRSIVLAFEPIGVIWLPLAAGSVYADRPFCRSNRVAGNTLTSAAVSIKKLRLL